MDARRLAQLVAKVLKEELREDEHTREQGLEQFRDWILKNQDIKNCPTDDSFLLPFLRVRKHSVLMAEQTLLRLLRFKHNYPELNSNLDIEDPDLNDIVTSGICFASPFHNTNGETVFFSIPSNQDLCRHTHQMVYRAYFLNCHAMSLRVSSLVLGLILIIDYNQISAAYFASYPLTALKALLDSAEMAFPIRLKKIHVINFPSFATRILNIVLKFFSEKVGSRILFHSTYEELHKHVATSALPKEYGGTMPTVEMIGLWKKELAVHREAILALNNIKLAGDSFKNDLGSNDTGVPDLPGSFRKLQVD